ncbi:hypothetical protein [Bacteroides timonensis]|uniref:hypothetical protein n=1 Tax=Bacteroides timonensis TaxID=1470345 RepID=UPI0005C4B377|nr:hypothetical protein [Bacteroides timonensis]
MYDFSLLKPISKTIGIIGKILFFLGLVIGIITLFNSDFSSGISFIYNIAIGLAILLGGGITGLLLIAFSHLINLFLQIEENTRKPS